jgi:3-dehydroquinate synthase
MTELEIKAENGAYPVYIGSGLLSRASELLDLNRRIFIITDDGVPKEYAGTVCRLCKEGHVFTVRSGEASKSIEVFHSALSAMLKLGFSRKDCVIAVGGGVCGDLAGFVAASYMRGVDFYNIPTTTLSQIDSSVGGKVAVNLDGYKNSVGAFYPPRAVIIDTDTLLTLDKRQYASGLCEAVKMAICQNESLFKFFEENEINKENIAKVITEALKIKRAVVERDEREGGIRKILNFGHTYGHAIESQTGMGSFTHGECVALGMIPMCEKDVRKRLVAVLKKLGLPTEYTPNFDTLEKFLSHDKKAEGDSIFTVVCEKVGEAKTAKTDIASLIEKIKAFTKED